MAGEDPAMLGWQASLDEGGNLYWYNAATGNSQWETPEELPWELAEQASQQAYVWAGWNIPTTAPPPAEVFVVPRTPERTAQSPDWVRVRSSNGKHYYYCKRTGESRWSLDDVPKQRETPPPTRSPSPEPTPRDDSFSTALMEMMEKFREERSHMEDLWSARLQDKVEELERLRREGADERRRLLNELSEARERAMNEYIRGRDSAAEEWTHRLVEAERRVSEARRAEEKARSAAEAARKAEEIAKAREEDARTSRPPPRPLPPTPPPPSTSVMDESVLREAVGKERAAWERRVSALEAEWEARLREHDRQWEDRLRRTAAEAEELARREMQAAVEAAEAGRAEAAALYQRELAARRALHNQLVDLKGTIRVLARVRPVLPVEQERGGAVAVDCPSDDQVNVWYDRRRRGEAATAEASTAYPFQFDRVFASHAPQEDVFEEVQPLVTSLLDGYNVCVFAYGQTGSGKTYTMEGPPDRPGVNRRTLQELFRLQTERGDERGDRSQLWLSVLEVHNEEVHDLLAPSGAGAGAGAPLPTAHLSLHSRADGRVEVEGLTSVSISSYEEAMRLMDRAAERRAVGAHNMNEHSSRSHLVVTVRARTERRNGQVMEAKLNLIDLAGSERIGKTEAAGERLKEAQHINRSLSALGDVMEALVQRQKPGRKGGGHVPFRNSKLTFLLQDALCNGSKVMMFVNVSPASWNAHETLCSLRFAERCRAVSLGPAKSRVVSGEEADVQKLQARIRELEALLAEARR